MREITRSVKRKKILSKLKKIFLFYFLPIIFSLIFFVFLFNWDKFQIKNLKLNKEKFVFLNQEKIKKEVLKNLDGKYFHILSKKNIFFYPKSEIRKKILDANPEISKLNFRLKNNNLFLEINEEKPIYLFCQNQCYFLNSKGKIFAFQKNKISKDNIIFYTDKKKKIGDNLFRNDEEKEKIFAFQKKLKENFGLEIKKIYIFDKLYYIFETKKAKKIIVDFDFIPENDILKMKKISKLENLKIKNNLFPEKLDYLNLIFKDRIVYCLKGDPCEGSY